MSAHDNYQTPLASRYASSGLYPSKNAPHLPIHHCVLLTYFRDRKANFEDVNRDERAVQRQETWYNMEVSRILLLISRLLSSYKVHRNPILICLQKALALARRSWKGSRSCNLGRSDYTNEGTFSNYRWGLGDCSEGRGKDTPWCDGTCAVRSLTFRILGPWTNEWFNLVNFRKLIERERTKCETQKCWLFKLSAFGQVAPAAAGILHWGKFNLLRHYFLLLMSCESFPP